MPEHIYAFFCYKKEQKMDDTQKDGSDSDWDSTLDFTSPRQVGIGKLPPGIEVEEESSLSGESDLEGEEDLPKDQHVIKNVLKPTEDRPRAPSPNQKENNIVLAQRQQAGQPTQQTQRIHQSANQRQQKAETPEPPPYNFREAITDKRQTPEPLEKGPPGKEKKGTAYEPAPSPTPRGIQIQQGSTRSIGSWDESDPDERTLKEIRTNYRQEKQKEEQKMKEEDGYSTDEFYRTITEEVSVAEDNPPTARSETTWKSWTKFGKKNKGTKNRTQSQAQAQVTQATPRSQGAPQQTARSQGPVTQLTAPSTARRADAATPSMVEVIEPRYSRSPQPPVSQVQYVQYSNPPLTSPVVESVEEQPFDEPKQLFMKDEDTGRYVYYFGHGNLRYFEVNEDFEEAALPPIADKVDRVVQRVWQEVFALFRILLSIVIWFCVELFKFLARHIFQPLIVGIFVTFGDFVMKPLLSAIFNGFVQPGSIFFWNVFTGMRHMFSPISEILRRVLEQFAMLFRAIRLCDVTLVSGRDNLPQPLPHMVQTV